MARKNKLGASNGKGHPTRAENRAARLSEALRSNLQRRKAQARLRRDGEADTGNATDALDRGEPDPEHVNGAANCDKPDTEDMHDAQYGGEPDLPDDSVLAPNVIAPHVENDPAAHPPKGLRKPGRT